jgi:hypothetical protein
VLLAASPLVEGTSGRYFENCAEASVVESRPEQQLEGVAGYALDAANAQRPWEMSLLLLDQGR